MKNTHTSLELSKKLAEAGCDLESDAKYIKIPSLGEEEWGWKLVNANHITIMKDCKYPAYDILNDIACRHAKEFFGDKIIKESAECSCDDDYCVIEKEEYKIHTMFILGCMQCDLDDKSFKILERYIWKNCKLNKDS